MASAFVHQFAVLESVGFELLEANFALPNVPAESGILSSANDDERSKAKRREQRQHLGHQRGGICQAVAACAKSD